MMIFLKYISVTKDKNYTKSLLITEDMKEYLAFFLKKDWKNEVIIKKADNFIIRLIGCVLNIYITVLYI